MNVIAPEATILWTSIVFLLLLTLLRKFAWKPILGAVKSRENSINEALQTAEKAREEIKDLKADNERVLAEAREEREAILKEAHEVKVSLIEEAKADAEAKAKTILEGAKMEIKGYRDVLVQEMKKTAAETALAITEEVLSTKLGDDKVYNEVMKKELENFKMN